MSQAAFAFITHDAKDQKPFADPRVASDRFEAYIVTCVTTGKQYVGITTKGYELRWRKHVYDATCGGSEAILHRAMRKYGHNSFTVALVTTASSWSELCDIECRLIKAMGNFRPDGYNGTRGGEGTPGRTDSAETRAKKSVSMTRALATPEGRDAVARGIVKRLSNPVWLAARAEIGRRLANDPEWIAAATARNKQFPLDPEWRAALAVGLQKQIRERDKIDPSGVTHRAKMRGVYARAQARKSDPSVPTIHDIKVAAHDVADPDGAEARARKRESGRRSNDRTYATRAARKAGVPIEPLKKGPKGDNLEWEARRKSIVDAKIAEKDAADPSGIEKRRGLRARENELVAARKAGIKLPRLRRGTLPR